MKNVTVLFGLIFVAGACSDFAMAPNRTPTELRVSPDTAVVNAGDSLVFQLTVLDQDGVAYETLPPWSPPFWVSSDESLLTVNEAGSGSSWEAGESRVDVELAGLRAAALVRANPAELGVSVAFAYVTQSAQRRDGSVPLVAGRDALLRVYLQGTGPNFFRPSPEARFYQGGTLVHTARAEPDAVGLPEDVDEGDLRLSYDVEVPGSVVQPGVTLEIDVDPDGTIPMAAGSQTRIPETGRMALDVRTVTPFRVRLVPVYQTYTQSESNFTAASIGETLQLTADIFPVGAFDLDLRASYSTDANLATTDGWFQLIQEIAVLRLDDGSPRYYYGGFNRPWGSSYLGLGYVGYPVSIGADDRDDTIAHELGHNLGLPHAPCGGPSGVDPLYPYWDGSTGVYGYDPSGDAMKDPAENFDLMTYCDPVWISDYNYEKVLAYRDTSAYDALAEAAAASAAPAQDVVMISGGAFEGELRLSPAFTSRTQPQLPEPGPYTLEGLAASGEPVFSVPVAPRALDHGGALFTAALPVTLADPERIVTFRLTGPEGVVERSRSQTTSASPPEVVVDPASLRQVVGEALWNTDTYPLAVVRDRETGEIVAMARSGRLPLPANISALEVVLSDGVVSHAARLVMPGGTASAP